MPAVDSQESHVDETGAEIPEEDRIRGLVEVLSSYIERYHGGSIEMVSFDGDTLKVKMLGACAHCSISAGTLHGWVEGNVRQFFPDLKSIEAV